MSCTFHLLLTRSILKILEHPLILIIPLRMIHCSLGLHVFQPILCVYTGSLVAYLTWRPSTFFFNGLEVYLHQVPLTFTYFQKLHLPFSPWAPFLIIWYIHSAVFNAELRNRLSPLAHKPVCWNMWLWNKYLPNN